MQQVQKQLQQLKDDRDKKLNPLRDEQSQLADEMNDLQNVEQFADLEVVTATIHVHCFSHSRRSKSYWIDWKLSNPRWLRSLKCRRALKRIWRSLKGLTR